ncbi:HAD-IB family hydrolase [Acinetobacter gerneri]|jgi:HAD superfamily hydrolase (TIGR01490 family)|uniref:HAD hydrolase, family IB n=2 Tax=Acinetobacter gerneri TaxID=202952 RepID=N8Y9R3_9GAMM|nr:HAD-IB family hydrolase [Acinetobacter gerneri]ENV33507.1 HAD hydrolase, family IB [Acinetobacter gerneri DSM 14967 = CIP 107464 = MTCC 9824]EPR84811.1 Phosphoserine phosphatase [Acinetobacter gerneri DSM 14967 = CIP 107464 = MTCC 9824]MCH4244779.1 HAD-IB family hydrolase [Acinetobacter gerneri]MDQ9012032.1 HAD-IB family hydrolase [Acinetobacter gerneri]MDQ9016129.1 HAD-IB family hydrolase [Acinetobacter gerneri]
MYAPRQENKNLALFDFDGTLCKKDSFTGFIFYALSKRHIVKQGLKILPWIQAYYLNVYPANSMRPKLYNAMFRNANADEIRILAQEYAPSLLNHLNKNIYKQFLIHKQNGDEIVIVSASIDIYLEIICEILEVKLICTKTEIKNDKLTGSYATADCSCEQKRIRVLDEYNLDHYHNVYAYGNSNEDLEMCALADFSYIVGRDNHLPKILNHKKDKSKELT